jgi:hypothetical protein
MVRLACGSFEIGSSWDGNNPIGIGRNVMTVRDIDGPASDMAYDLTRKFHQRIAQSGFLLAPTPGCPRTGAPAEGFVQSYTFDIDDLVAKMESHVAVHHGAVPDRIASRLHFLYRSSPIIYAHRALGEVDLNIGQIRDIIEGRVSEWGALGYGHKSIVPLFHDGVVNDAVFRTIAAQSFGARRVRADLNGYGSYEHLAKKGGELAGSIVFGLRPEFAPATMLRPISLAGKWPGSAMGPDQYPSLPVWLSLPDDCSVGALARYLNLVAARMAKDALALQKIAGRGRTRIAA